MYFWKAPNLRHAPHLDQQLAREKRTHTPWDWWWTYALPPPEGRSFNSAPQNVSKRDFCQVQKRAIWRNHSKTIYDFSKGFVGFCLSFNCTVFWYGFVVLCLLFRCCSSCSKDVTHSERTESAGVSICMILCALGFEVSKMTGYLADPSLGRFLFC